MAALLNWFFSAPIQAQAAAPTTPEALLKGGRKSEVYTQAKQNPLQAYFGRVINPDPTLARFGGGEGFDLFYRIRRQITAIGGIVGQLVDGALKRKPMVIPGDASNSESVRLADDIRLLWESIPGKSVSLRKTVDTLITCGFAPLELVWGRDERSGIVAPIGEARRDGTHGPGLIDRPARNFAFDLDGNPKFLSVVDPFIGEAIEPLKFIFLRAGSLNTEFGESEFGDIYSAAWLYQQVQQFALDALEKFGRPIPHLLIPRSKSPEDVANLDTFYTNKFGGYTRDLYDGTEVKIEWTNPGIAAAGAAGRSELEMMRFLEGRIYIRLLRTQQTQDKTGGSRALESSRHEITDLATLTYSDILCEGLQDGWMRPTMQINFPEMDPKFWPRIVPDHTGAEDKDKLHKRIIDALDRGVEFSKEWYFRFYGIQEAKDASDVLGHPKTTITSNVPLPLADPNAADAMDAEDIADSGVDEATEPPDDAADPETMPMKPAAQVAIATNTGAVMHFNDGALVLTSNRGLVAVNELRHGDELVTPLVREN